MLNAWRLAAGRFAMAAAVCVAGATWAVQAHASEEVEKKAEELLKAMTTHLAGLETFAARATVAEDRIMSTGLKLTFHRDVELAVKRPDRFVAKRRGMVVDQAFVYDGKRLHGLAGRAGIYVSIDAPATIDETLDFAVDQLGLHAPGADLIYNDAYGGLMEDVESGNFVGTGPLNGVQCHQLVFRGAEVDWHIWIRAEGDPLPCKYVVTSKWLAAAPMFAMTFHEWKTATDHAPGTFEFKAPADAKQVSPEDARFTDR